MKKFLLSFLLLYSSFYFSQSDCISAIPVCGSSNLSFTPSGHGDFAEELGGCMSTDERFTVWYTFTAASAGTLAFTITPNNMNDDYDFAVYGPNIPCSQVGTPSGQPIRCNYSGTRGLTGLSLTVTHPATSGTWSGALNVQPGETYILVVDNYSMSTNGFTLNWSGTSELVSPFDDPNIQINPFMEPGQNNDGIVHLCNYPSSFDFSTLSAQIINGNPNFSVSYHYDVNGVLSGDNPILNPIAVSTSATYHYAISYVDPADPDNPLSKCKEYGTVKFVDDSFTLTPATIMACSNYNTGIAVYDLTTAVVYNGTQNMVSTKFYPTYADAVAETNEIPPLDASMFTSPESTVYVKYISEYDCVQITSIKLEFYPPIEVMEDTLISCFIPTNPKTADFDLTQANITTTIPNTTIYYPSLQDAINNTNPIANPNVYTSIETSVYARVISPNLCWNISKINLSIIPPTYSLELKDKVICIEGRTTLDAGNDFTSYLWSTGATTQTISNVTVGEYWVDLTKDGCVTRQTVKVMASASPVVTSIDINNNTLTVNVKGATEPYKYSIDNINWQDSNVFEGVKRGQNTVYVKDSYNCTPVSVEITVPNLVNAISPNNDGANDFLDYSELSYKKDLVISIFDRYGNKIFTADKNNFYRWDGRAGNKKVPTGTYWYTITWKEPATDYPVKYSGWILVKYKE